MIDDEQPLGEYADVLTIGSLCSGGLDLAVEQVTGGRTVWHCEPDPDASKVLEKRWPGVPNHGNAYDLALRMRLGDPSIDQLIDVVTAGYPCQPFSTAGERKGTADERHLWPHICEAIRILRPRLVVLENVAGHRPLGFDCVLADLAKIGYDAQWCSVRASDVGAPHRRERIFVIAYPSGDGRSRVDGGACSAQARRGWERQPSGSTWGTSGPVDLLPTPTASRYPSNRSPSPGAAVRPSLDSIVDLLPTPRKSDGDGGPNPLTRAERMDDVETRVIRLDGQWGKYAAAIPRWEALTRPAPSPTQLSRNGNHRLNPAFSEWMIGYPLGWVTDIEISRNAQLRIIGNSVVPQQAVAALSWLLSLPEVAA